MPFPSPEDLPNPRIEARYPALQADSLHLRHQGRVCILNMTENVLHILGDIMSDKEKVIEAFKNSEEPLNAKKVSELSGVEKKEVDKIMKELKKDETIVSPKDVIGL